MTLAVDGDPQFLGNPRFGGESLVTRIADSVRRTVRHRPDDRVGLVARRLLTLSRAMCAPTPVAAGAARCGRDNANSLPRERPIIAANTCAVRQSRIRNAISESGTGLGRVKRGR